MTKGRAVFFGNCQAPALQRILGDHEPFAAAYDIVPMRAVHVLTVDEKTALLEAVTGADLVIHQPVGAAYEPATTENIVKALKPGAQSITFPVFWFDGYAPEQVYLRGKINGQLLMDYHSRIIFAGYLRGMTPSQVAEASERPDLYSPDSLTANVAANIKRLGDREAKLDIRVAPFIAENYRARNLFFTFNHPTGWLLYHVVDQMLGLLGLPTLGVEVKKKHAAALGGYRWRGISSVYAGLRLAFPPPTTFVRGPKVWDVEAFATDWYRFYDQNPDLVSTHANVSLNGANL